MLAYSYQIQTLSRYAAYVSTSLSQMDTIVLFHIITICCPTYKSSVHLVEEVACDPSAQTNMASVASVVMNEPSYSRRHQVVLNHTFFHKLNKLITKSLCTYGKQSPTHRLQKRPDTQLLSFCASFWGLLMTLLADLWRLPHFREFLMASLVYLRRCHHHTQKAGLLHPEQQQLQNGCHEHSLLLALWWWGGACHQSPLQSNRKQWWRRTIW